MLVAPVVVGAIVAGPTWRHALLLVAWLVAYCAFSATGLWLRSGRRARYVPPMRFHVIATAVIGGALLAVAPGLVRWGPLYAVLLAVSLASSVRRADRSWLNDAVTVLAAMGMTVVSVGLVGGWPPGWLPPGADEGTAWQAAGLLTGYFFGTVPYVKSLIRDRGDRVVLAVSVGWHAALVAAAAAWLEITVANGGATGWAVLPLAVATGLLLRATLVPRRRPWPSARAIGLGEVAATLVVTVAAVLVVR